MQITEQQLLQILPNARAKAGVFVSALNLAMAQFQVDVVAHASDATTEVLPAPKCFKCKKATVEAVRAQDDAIVWFCPRCRSEGRISNWQGSLWDLRDRPADRG